MKEYKASKRKSLQGWVVSDKMEKTRVVEVERTVRHPMYKKIMRKKKKYYVHDRSEESKTGDFVTIRQTRPLSRLKRWRIVEIIKGVKSETTGKSKNDSAGEHT
jgi:small subunit ribosomal protein S17